MSDVLRALQALRAATNLATDLAHAGEPIGDHVTNAYRELRRMEALDIKARRAANGIGCPVCLRAIGTRGDGLRKSHRTTTDPLSARCTGSLT